jgi:hypothetical protein
MWSRISRPSVGVIATGFSTKMAFPASTMACSMAPWAKGGRLT